jgi:CsoR family transcriptional regulator, copper-sensing transcriptional repressor
MPGYVADKDALLNRLKRVEGQVRGLQRMVEDERYCIDVVTQVGAVRSALEEVALQLLDDHARHCVAAGDAGADELVEAVGRFIRTR